MNREEWVQVACIFIMCLSWGVAGFSLGFLVGA